MTSRTAWQTHERFWAAIHGETRTGPRGLGLPDATQEHCSIGIECKCQGTRRLLAKDMQQAADNSATSHWALILHTTGTRRIDDVVVLPALTYIDLLNHRIPAPNQEEL